MKNTAAPRPDLLLLPVNGRSEALAARGIAGNLTLDEAVTLTVESEAPAMIAHHYRLFAFNTLPVADIERRVAEPGLPISSGCHRHVGRGRLRRSSWANIGPNFHTHRRTVS